MERPVGRILSFTREDEARRFVEMSSSERVDFVAWLNFDRIRATNLLRE